MTDAETHAATARLLSALETVDGYVPSERARKLIATALRGMWLHARESAESDHADALWESTGPVPAETLEEMAARSVG
jgi:hypothetical protein